MMFRKIVSLTIIFCFTFSSVSFAFAGSNLRTEQPSITGVAKELTQSLTPPTTGKEFFVGGMEVDWNIWEFVPGDPNQIRQKDSQTVIAKRQADGKFAIFSGGKAVSHFPRILTVDSFNIFEGPPSNLIDINAIKKVQGFITNTKNAKPKRLEAMNYLQKEFDDFQKVFARGYPMWDDFMQKYSGSHYVYLPNAEQLTYFEHFFEAIGIIVEKAPDMISQDIIDLLVSINKKLINLESELRKEVDAKRYNELLRYGAKVIDSSKLALAEQNAKLAQAPIKDFPNEGLTGTTPTGVGPAMGDGGTTAGGKENQPTFNPLYTVFRTILQSVLPADRGRDHEARSIKFNIMPTDVAYRLGQTVNEIEPYIRVLEEWGLISITPNPYGEGFSISPIQLTTAAATNAYKDPILVILKRLPSAPLTSAEQEEVRKQIAQILGTVPPAPAAANEGDYAFTGTFIQRDRNEIFGLETERQGLFGLVGEALVAPDLDAGLLNTPGARYYLWDGRELKYFVAVGNVKRITIDKNNKIGSGYTYLDHQEDVEGDPDLEKITDDNEEAKLVKEFFSKNKVDYPCYVIASIPGAIDEGDISFNDYYQRTNLTRLANMPVMTLGLVKSNPYIALAKMAHERAAFEAKQQGKSGDEQHAAGLDAEFHSVELMNLKDKELSDEARKELINLLNNISEELIRLGNVRKDLEENKVFGKEGGDYSASAPAEKEAALAKLLSIANVADKEILTDSVTWDNLLARFGISMAEETGLIISIDAVAEGLGAVLVGLANRDVSIYVVVDKNSEVQTKLLHEFNKRIPKEENKIEFTDSVADAAFNLEAYVGTESKIRYVGTDENIASLSEQFKKAFIITPAKRIIEHMGMLGFENLKTMFEDFQQSCVRLGLV